jgi:hypothetical protein
VDSQEKQRGAKLQLARRNGPNPQNNSLQNSSDTKKNQRSSFENERGKDRLENKLNVGASRSKPQAGASVGDSGQKYKERLQNARKSGNGGKKAATGQSLQDAKNLGKNVSPVATLSLFKQIDFTGDIPYAIALLMAVLKDISDFVFIGSLPGLGTVISICCSIFIWMMMFIVGAGEKKKVAGKWIRKILTLLGGTVGEMITAINFLPIETIMVGFLYYMVLSDRKNAKE